MRLLAKLNILSSLKNKNIKILNLNYFKKPFLIYKANNGVMSCKYLDLDTAEKSGDVLCRFTNVNSIEDMINSKVVDCTTNAKELGITEGMDGLEAYYILNKK